ncbi:MAG TPA: folylpolyglutamate synthase/dihydrofolate synthase family protein [Candidatus Methylacidiphilales bacterium]|nr:folylpolyglutamate synthase/dihydrofolate synthase family protein [Candidatus Methylacidiphilales bacterium]
MTYHDALSYLGEARRFGVKLGLGPMRRLAGALGNPQERLRFMHIAGTNGKGSTAAFCESCLRASGHRTGLYTSPHLVSVRERIQIDRQPISETDFAAGMGAVRGALEEMEGYSATFFEIMTALALWYFAREKVEWVVWETGLGGRLDATNIVRPEVCIITNIGLDHQKHLGSTLAEIAAEKAAIIKPRAPVVSAVDPGEAREVIVRRARAKGSGLTLVQRDMKTEDLGLDGNRQLARIGGRAYRLGLIGSHQVMNAACAAQAVKYAGVSREALMCGLESARWPGRFDIISEKPLMVVDGAHNPAGAMKLADTWRAFLAARFGWSAREAAGRAHLVFASVADKDVAEMARPLRLLAQRVSLVRLANERTADPAWLEAFFPDLPVTCYNSVADMWHDLVTAPGDIPVLVAGSLFLVGEMLAQRQNDTEEYRLNERLDAPVTAR